MSKFTVSEFIGVNVVKPSFKLEPGELQSAQNAELYTDQGRRALRTRAGFQSVAALGLGSIKGAIGIPLQAPIVGTAANAKHRVYAATTGGWLRSTDAGGTFASTTDLARTQSTPFMFPGTAAGAWSDYVGIKTGVQLGRQFFHYMSDGSGAVFVMGYNGTDEYPVVRLASDVTAQPMFTANGQVYLVLLNLISGLSTLVAIDPVTGEPEIQTAVLATPEVFTGGCAYQGYLWVCTALNTGGRVLSSRPGDTAWIQDRDAAAAAQELNYATICPYAAAGAVTAPTYLYVGSYSEASNARIIKRALDGTYSTVLTSPDTGASASTPVFYSHLTRYNGDLYVAYTKVAAGATTVCKIFKTSDGTTWASDKDLLADGGHCVANIQVVGTDLYVACVANGNLSGSAAALFRRRAGVWTKVSTAAVAGPLGII